MREEIRNNFSTFQTEWIKELTSRLTDLPTRAAKLEESYIRLTSLQAWRAGIIEPHLSSGSAGFFAEAQNDALIAHVQASLGSWRVALKSLRSCLENVLLGLYYKDHPVELKLWEAGRFRLGVSEAIQYFQSHPLVHGLPESITGLGIIHQEYGKLSKAVHASSVDFRMTADGKAVSLWTDDKAREGVWESHEKKTLQGLNLLMLVMFSESLRGTSLSSIRQTLGFVIPRSKDQEIKDNLKVTIKR